MGRRRLLHRSARLLARATTRLTVLGEPPPMDRACLIAPNHLAHWDPLCLVAALPRPPALVALAELTRTWAAPFVHLYGAIPVYRDEFDRDILRSVLEVLGRDEPLAIFPEAKISRTGALERARNGVGYLALLGQVPIVPVAISGTERVYPALRKGQRAPVMVRFGAPIPHTLAEGLPRRAQRQALTDATMHAIAAMLPAEYRGVYAEGVERGA